MNPSLQSFAWGRFARIAALGAGLMLLAGCVVPYSYVQSGYGGGYYTSSGPAPGYYYDQSGDAYYGGGYGYAYGPPVGLTLGITSGWGWPGYYGYDSYGYRHAHRWSGGERWHHHSGDHGYHHGHGSWSGPSSHDGWSRPSGGGQVRQPRGVSRPVPATAPSHAPARRLYAPSPKRR